VPVARADRRQHPGPGIGVARLHRLLGMCCGGDAKFWVVCLVSIRSDCRQHHGAASPISDVIVKIIVSYFRWPGLLPSLIGPCNPVPATIAARSLAFIAPVFLIEISIRLVGLPGSLCAGLPIGRRLGLAQGDPNRHRLRSAGIFDAV